MDLYYKSRKKKKSTRNTGDHKVNMHEEYSSDNTTLLPNLKKNLLIFRSFKWRIHLEVTNGYYDGC